VRLSTSRYSEKKPSNTSFFLAVSGGQSSNTVFLKVILSIYCMPFENLSFTEVKRVIPLPAFAGSPLAPVR
jgi:hypothetical protein